MKNLQLLLIAVSSSWGAISAFQSSAPTPRSTFVRSPLTVRHAVVPPEVHSLLADSVNTWSQLLNADTATTTAAADALTASSMTLAAAAEAAAEAAKEESSGGWWASYLNIFKSSLLLVHNAIDQPLRNAGFTQTWGVSIAIFTATVRSLLLPLSFQQAKSTEYVKALKPYMTEIREKFKDNKDAQNRAIGKLYEDANQNPLAGCLVSLAQLPIFLGLYRGVRLLAIDGELDEPFLWIPSLEGPVTAESDYRGLDWLLQGWQHLPDGSWEPSLGWATTIGFMIMPVLLVLGQSVSMQVLTPPIDDSMGQEEKEQMEKSQVVLKFLPLLIGFFSLQVPAGLTIYWFTSNWFTLAQSLAVRAYYKANPPQIELPEYWDALEDMDNMSPAEKRKAAEAGISVGPKWEDLLDEAKFHTLVDRQPLRETNPAWQRVMASSSSSTDPLTIPTEFQSWVQTPSHTTSTCTSTTNSASTSAVSNADAQLEPAASTST